MTKTEVAKKMCHNFPTIRAIEKGTQGGDYVGKKAGRGLVNLTRKVTGKDQEAELSKGGRAVVLTCRGIGIFAGAEIAMFGTLGGTLQLASSATKAIANKTGLREKDSDSLEQRTPRIQRMHEAWKAKRQGNAISL